MTFIQLEFSNGNKVYVNPEQVRYVTKDDCNEGMCNVSIQGMTLHVKGDAKFVSMKIARGYTDE